MRHENKGYFTANAYKQYGGAKVKCGQTCNLLLFCFGDDEEFG